MYERIVRMFPVDPSGNAPSLDPAKWFVMLPDNTPLDTTGSTSQGWQEAEWWAYENGCNLIVDGGQVRPARSGETIGQDTSIIQCTGPVVLPPQQKGVVIRRGITFNFPPPASAGLSCVTADSAIFGKSSWEGCQIVASSGWERILHVKPRTLLPQDTVAGKVIGTTNNILPALVAVGAATDLLYFDISEGSISYNKWLVIEPNGGRDQIVVSDPGETMLFRGNEIEVIGAHKATRWTVRLGVTGLRADHIYDNHIYGHCLPDTGGSGVEIWGEENTIRLSVDNTEGSPLYGCVFRSTAKRNTFISTRLKATTPILDQSDKSNKTIMPRISVFAGISAPVSVPQGGPIPNPYNNGINPGWDVIKRNIGNCFASGIFTAPYPGFYSVKSKGGMAALPDQTFTMARVLINGTSVDGPDVHQNASGSGGIQGPFADAMVWLDAGDQMEVRYRQDNPVTQTLHQAIQNTWLQIDGID